MSKNKQTGVKLWIFWNGDWARIVVRPAAPVVMNEYTTTDEGFYAREEVYSLVDGRLFRKKHLRSRDCDGPIETFEYRVASMDRLTVLETGDPDVTVPEWRRPNGLVDEYGHLVMLSDEVV